MIPITCNAVGDILALAELLVDVVRALNDARGSALEYRTFTRELDGLRTMLTTAARVAEDSADRALRDEIIREVDQCGRDVQLVVYARLRGGCSDDDDSESHWVKIFTPEEFGRIFANCEPEVCKGIVKVCAFPKYWPQLHRDKRLQSTAPVSSQLTTSAF